jgi:hypothetical protein
MDFYSIAPVNSVPDNLVETLTFGFPSNAGNILRIPIIKYPEFGN